MDIHELTTPRYLLVKFIPDLARNEPRNVGVVVWSRQGTAARFVGERSTPGEVDGRYVPGAVGQVLAGYKQWVQYWQMEINKPVIGPYLRHSHETTDRGSSLFLQTLKGSAKGNFMLEDGGVLLDELSDDVAPRDLADYLFRNLVADPSIDEPKTEKDADLQKMADNAFQKAGMSCDPHFRNDYTLDCQIAKGVQTRLHFSHAYENGSLTLMQKVSFPKSPGTLRNNVRSNAFMFEQVLNTRRIESITHGCALIYVSEDRAGETEVKDAMQLLSAFSTVYNLYDQEDLFIKLLRRLQAETLF